MRISEGPHLTRHVMLQCGLTGAGAGASLVLLPHEVLTATARSKPAPDFTVGHHEPTRRELTGAHLEVEGAVPSSLSGRCLRNGHNRSRSAGIRSHAVCRTGRTPF